MAEAVEALFHFLALVVELFIRLLLGSISLVAYALWPAFRRKRNAEWAGQSWRKYSELGFSAACLVGLIAFFTYPSAPPKLSPEAANALAGLIKSVHLEPRATNEDLRLRIEGLETNSIVSVRTNGLSNIFATKTLRDLTNSIRENVTVQLSSTDQPGASLKSLRRAGEPLLHRRHATANIRSILPAQWRHTHTTATSAKPISWPPHTTATKMKSRACWKCHATSMPKQQPTAHHPQTARILRTIFVMFLSSSRVRFPCRWVLAVVLIVVAD